MVTMFRITIIICIAFLNQFSQVEAEIRNREHMLSGFYRDLYPIPPPVQSPIPIHCGKSKYQEQHHRYYGSLLFPEISKRIVGGQISESGEWPWLVSMQLTFENKSITHMCGGSLISNLWVISAAHCFEKEAAPFLTNDPRYWTARIGEHNMFDEGDEQDEVEISKIIFHPKRDCCSYEFGSLQYDIVLIKLARPVKLNDEANVVCLPGFNEVIEVGAPCLVTGWGHTEEKGEVSNSPQHVLVHVVDNAICDEWYGSVAERAVHRIYDTMVCAGEEDGGKDSCQYDSGGPLVYYNKQDRRWILIGIVSNGNGCARAKFPGIYTRVSSFIPWIERTVKFE